MIDRDDVGPPRGLEVFLSHDLEPEQGAAERAETEGEDVRRQPAEEIGRRPDIGDAEDDQRHRLAQPQDLQQDHGRKRTADHPDVTEGIDRGDDASAPVLAGPGLNRGEDRNDKQARGGRINE